MTDFTKFKEVREKYNLSTKPHIFYSKDNEVWYVLYKGWFTANYTVDSAIRQASWWAQRNDEV